MNHLPNKIWFFWQQGYDEMPELVNACYHSWVHFNPNFEFIFLDQNNFSDYVKIDKKILNNKNISIQAFSDILRISLLKEHGGIWVDATLFCTKPLQSWLFEYMNSGFFAFAAPYNDRMISSWFLAAQKESVQVRLYYQAVVDYWQNNTQLRNLEKASWVKKKVVFGINRLLQMGNLYWYSILCKKLLQVYPYLWFHYLFEKLYIENPQFKLLWDSSPKFSATVPHYLMDYGYHHPLNEQIKHHIDRKEAPFYKLSHKKKLPIAEENTTIGYLFAVYKSIIQ